MASLTAALVASSATRSTCAATRLFVGLITSPTITPSVTSTRLIPPEVARADNESLAIAARDVVQALAQMKARGWVDDQTAAALAFAVPAAAQTQFEAALGVTPGAFTTAELIQLDRAYEENDTNRINFILSGGSNLTPAEIERRGLEQVVLGVTGRKDRINRCRHAEFP